MKTKILILVLVLSLVVEGLALANGGDGLARWALSGGASDSTAGAVSLRGTLGQPVVGAVSNGSITLGQGFWYGGGLPEDDSVIYLPIVLK